ncbi:hypothetical protein STVA_44470 [Allostella vacuolata]|nr:hypothetical protein STVA_44470 [Stella vacuolata]
MLALGVLLSLGGCVELEVSELGQAKNFRGVPYSLPYTSFDTVVTWRLVACSPAARIAADMDATVRILPDPAHRYVIDTNSLSSWFKTSSLQIDRHENGMLKSVNADAQDQSAQVIGNLVKSAVGIATLAAGGAPVGTLAVAGVAARRTGDCQAAAAMAVEAADAAATALRAATARVGEARERVAEINRQLAEMGPQPDAAALAKLRRALQQLDDRVTEQSAAEGRLSVALEPITARVHLRWPESGSRPAKDDILREKVPFPPGQLAKWVVLGDDAKAAETLNANAEVVLALGPIGGPSHAVPEGDRRPDPTLGIRFRDPVPSRLTATQQGRELASREAGVHQFGTLFHLPLRNVLFQSNELAVEMDAAGILTMARYADKAAAAATATGTLADLVGGIGAARQGRRDARLDRIQRENELLEAQKTRRDLLRELAPTVPVAPDETARRLADFKAETALAAAETEAIQAEIARREARARLAR